MTLTLDTIYNAVNDIDEDNPMPSRSHAQVAQRLSYYLQSHYGGRLEFLHQLSLSLKDWKTIPDLCAYPVGTLPSNWEEDETEVTVSPCLVIEILSPFQVVQSLTSKIKQYFQEGVGSCWLVMPILHTIIAHAPGKLPQAFSEGDFHDEVLDITIPLDKVFC